MPRVNPLPGEGYKKVKKDNRKTTMLPWQRKRQKNKLEKHSNPFRNFRGGCG
jgi:hypothetical protein